MINKEDAIDKIDSQLGKAIKELVILFSSTGMGKTLENKTYCIFFHAHLDASIYLFLETLNSIADGIDYNDLPEVFYWLMVKKFIEDNSKKGSKSLSVLINDIKKIKIYDSKTIKIDKTRSLNTKNIFDIFHICGFDVKSFILFEKKLESFRKIRHKIAHGDPDILDEDFDEIEFYHGIIISILTTLSLDVNTTIASLPDATLRAS